MRAARLLLGVVGERALERLDRRVLIARACKIHVSEAREDRGSLLGGRELRRRATRLLASSGHWRCGLEEGRVLRVDVARGAVRLDHLPPGLGRARRVLRLLREDLGGAERQLARLPAIAAVRDHVLRALLEHEREVHPVAALLVERLERGERAVAGRGVDEATPRADRRVRRRRDRRCRSARRARWRAASRPRRRSSRRCARAPRRGSWRRSRPRRRPRARERR